VHARLGPRIMEEYGTKQNISFLIHSGLVRADLAG
jgi:hypothetical protein